MSPTPSQRRLRAHRWSRRAACLVFVVPITACGDGSNAATVSFSSPADDAAIAGGVPLRMASEGITIEEAGEVRPDAGHFHVIANDGCVDRGDAVPRDADHVHFGGGASEGTIYLEPGSHELCLQAGDGAHVALAATDTVTIEVGVTDVDQWCAVIGEVDELFEEVDTTEDEFAVRQVTYENIRRLIAQLTEAVDFVDAGARDDMRSVLELNRAGATAYVQADDDAAAARALEPLYAEGEAQFATAEAWVLDTCGIAIDG